MAHLLKGIFPPIATPFKKKCLSVDYQSLKFNLEKLSKTKLKGILVQGSNGEFAALNDKERIELISKSKEYLSNDKVLLCGSGTEGTNTTIDMTNAMADAGADAAMVITPSYYKAAMNDEKLVKHFKLVADSSKIPIVLYNVPKFTNVHLTDKAILDLAEHENIIGMKESDGTCIEDKTPKIVEGLKNLKDPNFILMAGSAGFIQKHYALGGEGSVCALANVLPDLVCQLHDDPTNEDLQKELILPNDLVTAKYGVAGLKHAMDHLGFYGGPVRGPLVGLGDQAKIEIQNIFGPYKEVEDSW